MSQQRIFSSTALFALILGAAACSQAQEPPPPDTAAAEDERPAVLRNIERQGLEVFGEFEAPGGLRGFAGLAGHRPMAVYVTPDGGHVMVGVLLDAKGEDVAAEALQRLVAGPVSTRIWEQLEKSHWVQDGKPDAARVVYAFSDANCPFCHRFWQASRPWVDSGRVQLRHVMVGVIREDSANKAAAILSATSPEDALTRNELQYEQGGIAGLPAVSADMRTRLDANERLMLELGFQGTPGILFRDEDGVVQRRTGLPSAEDLATVLGPG